MQPRRRKKIKVSIYLLSYPKKNPLNPEQYVYAYFPAKASICKNIVNRSNCEKETVQCH